MQWLINEFKAFKEEITKKVAESDQGLAERVKKLEGELMALKARMGKKPEQQ